MMEIKEKKGYIALITIAVMTGLILIIVVALTNIVLTKREISGNLVKSAQSYYSAESGIEDSVMRILNGYDYVALNSFDLNGTAMDVSISQNGGITTIDSGASYENNERKIRTYLAITQDDISFHYGVQVGKGGLVMGNNSEITGNIYSDGSIIGGGSGSKIAGDAYVATGMAQDHAWSEYNSDGVFGKNSPVIDVAQSFQPSVSGILSQVTFYIEKIGNPNDKMIYVVSDGGGSPSKTVLASDTLTASKIGTSYGWVDFAFSTPPNLTAGTWYWIIIDTSESSSKYFTVGKDSNKGNGNGVSKYSADWNAGSPVWTEDTGDFDFKTWMGGQATLLKDVIVSGDAHAHEILSSYVCGDAYYQSIDAGSLDFVNNPTSSKCDLPLTSGTANSGSADPAVEPLPISDSNIADWKTDAQNAGNLNTSLCSINADVTIDAGVLDCTSAPDGAFKPGGGIEIIINGTLWVKGNIIISNGVKIRLSSGYGARSGIIIAHNPGNESTSGKITIENNVSICGSGGFNASPPPLCNPPSSSYILMLSTHSGTATNAITVSNNADGAIFYAHNGIASISNNADLKEVTAYKLNLAENATVTYESGLANTSFTSGPGGGWSISEWNESQ